MSFRRVSLVAACLWLGTILAASEGTAWEFRLEGDFNYNYEYYGQQGEDGFFGKFNVDRSVGVGGVGLKPGDFASINTWVGRQIGRSANDFASGNDAAKHYQNLELWPELRIHEAIRFRAKYRVGLYGDPINSDYITNTRPGTNVATSDGQWTMWWVTAQTPLGIIVVGKRPQAFGLGLLYDGAGSSTTEGAALVVPYGPLRIALAVRPVWQLPLNKALNQKNYYNTLDKSGLRQLAASFFTTYRAGPLDCGTFAAWLRWHAGSESQNTATERAAFNPYDLVNYQQTVYAKYNDGTFFFNSELAYYTETTNTLKTKPGPKYRESWRYMVEAGMYSGPSKATFLYAFMPGAERRAGALINKQASLQGMEAYSVFRPYSYLLGYGYGSGVNAFDFNGQGSINEAWVLAIRLDHAVASNLNMFGTFLWAERASHGYAWGYLRPNQTSTVTPIVNATGTVVNNVAWTPVLTYTQHAGAPNIPDTALGWEITGGFNWKLLEKYTLGGTLAYWKPGKWFHYACIDRSVPGWDNQTDASPFYPYGANLGRTIDPIIGGEVTLQVDF